MPRKPAKPPPRSNRPPPLDPGKVRARREAAGMTQGEAAAAAGMERPNWVRLEMGRRADPALSVAAAVARALGCKVDDLLMAGAAPVPETPTRAKPVAAAKGKGRAT